MRKMFFVAICFSLYFISESPTQTYKYVDKNGVVHFTETPTDSKYISMEKQTGTEGDARLRKYQNLMSAALAEFENPARTNQNEKAVCTEAVNILRWGMTIESSPQVENDFLETVERAIKNCKDIRSASGGTRVICHSGEAFALLEKARAIKGTSDDTGAGERKLQRKIRDLENDLTATKARIPIH